MSEDTPSSNDRGGAKKRSLLSGILKNTQDTSVRYDATKPRSETLTCKACGAARPEDASLESCDYCGNRFL